MCSGWNQSEGLFYSPSLFFFSVALEAAQDSSALWNWLKRTGIREKGTWLDVKQPLQSVNSCAPIYQLYYLWPISLAQYQFIHILNVDKNNV